MRNQKFINEIKDAEKKKLKTFYLVPFAGKTMDGPPTAPPTDVRVGVINNTAAYVRWSPPPSNMLNGELTGYKVSIIFGFCFPIILPLSLLYFASSFMHHFN